MSSPKSKPRNAKESSNQQDKRKGFVPTRNFRSGDTTLLSGTRETLSGTDATLLSLDEASKLTLSVPGILREAAGTFEERGKVYGQNYKEPFAMVMSGLSSAAGGFNTSDMTLSDLSRLGLLVQIAYKLTRYSNQFNNGGHLDSARDTSVYAAMLEELTANNLR
jgi:hypothetical protein